jgi:chromosome partition protein MukE
MESRAENAVSGTPYGCLQDVVVDPIFPEVDVALRRGRHFTADDGDPYHFLVDAHPFLQDLYARFQCELVRADGYFFLLPTGDRLGARHLTIGEMLIGQALALVRLDPTSLKTGSVVPRAQVLELLAGLVGRERLVRALNPRRKNPADERVAQENARRELDRAVRALVDLGFLDALDGDQLRVRAPVMRFAEPVVGIEDTAEGLRALIARGGAVLLDGATEEDEP